MKLLFFMQHPGSARNFEAVLRLLAERGHDLHIAFDGRGDAKRTVVEGLHRDFPRVTLGKAPADCAGPWAELSKALRLGSDYLRYLGPAYADAPALRSRARVLTPRPLPQIAGLPLVRGPRGIAALHRVAAALERLVPSPKAVDRYLRDREPDVVLVTPLVGLGAVQADYVRSARKLGIPTVFSLHSWDNLTNKGLLRDVPDRVCVWNDSQRAEAVDLHAVPAESVVVTGAHPYDHWFEWRPSRPRTAFCAEVGLDVAQPFFLYVCSSSFVAPDEVSFVRDWIAALRDCGDPRLREAGVLVRPHPQNAGQWRDASFADPQVAIWPREGANPMEVGDKSDYFESMRYSAGVVGINTTAIIESAILSRAVHTVLTEQFAATQTGTLHFRLLTRAAGGPLRVARSLDEHVAHLVETLADGGARASDRNRAFLEAFVRPHGLDRPAAPILVDAVERAAAIELRPAEMSLRQSLARVLMVPLALLVHLQLRVSKARRTFARRHERRRGRQAAADAQFEPDQQSADRVAAARDAVIALARVADRPIVAGPFSGDVACELLYWIPFLNWAIGLRPELAERTTVLSRGGADSWYAHLGVAVASLHDEPETVELQELCARLGLEEPLVLHPSTMSQAREQLLDQGDLLRSRDGTFDHRPLGAPPLGPLEQKLPDRFVAACFDFNSAFPATDENVAFARRTLERLAETCDVVLLDPPVGSPDPGEAEVVPSHRRIIRLDELMTAPTNLEVQTIAISRAGAFFGTYGGLSYMPSLLGVPALAFYSEAHEISDHDLEIATRISRRPGFGQLTVMDCASVRLAALALGSGESALELR